MVWNGMENDFSTFHTGNFLPFHTKNQGVKPNLNPNEPFHFGEPEPAKFYFSEPEPNLNPQNCAQVNPNRT